MSVGEFREMIEELRRCLDEDEYSSFLFEEFRVYVIPAYHKLDIDTYDGKPELTASQDGEPLATIKVAVRLERDKEFERLYPDNEFIPNIQMQMNRTESEGLMDYFRKAADCMVATRIS